MIEWIKEKINKIFNKDNKKMLNEANIETNIDENIVVKENKLNLDELVVKQEEKIEISKDQKIREILNLAGCSFEIFEKIENFQDIDEENLRLNLKDISNYNFSKLELSKILSQNEQLLYMRNEIVKNSFMELEKYIEDKQKIHEIVYLNPFVISENISNMLNEKKDIFEKYNISVEKQKNIISENPSVLNIIKEKLENSLNIIKSIFNDEKEFIDFIEYEPVVIGCENIELIKSYI